MKFIVISLVAIGLIVSGNSRADSPTRECERYIVANPELQVLKGKVELLFSADPPLEMLASNKIPTNKEKEALAAWVREQKKCKQLGDETYKTAPPEFVALIDKAYSDMFLLAVDLYEKKINYGAFAKGQVKVNDNLKTNMAALKQQQRQKQEERAQQEAATTESQRQRQCESLKQQLLIATNSEPTPYQAYQQIQAQQDAQAAQAFNAAGGSPGQLKAQALSNVGSAAVGLGAGMMGIEPDAVVQARQRQAALMQQVEIYKRNCQNQ